MYPSHIWDGSTHTALLKRWSLGLFALSTLLLSLIFSSLFLPAELLRQSLHYRYYNGHCYSKLSHRKQTTVRKARATRISSQSHHFSVLLFDSDLTTVLKLTCNLKVKSGTHSLHLFSQLSMTYTLSNAVYRNLSDFNLTTFPIFSLNLGEILVGCWLWPTRGEIKKIIPNNFCKYAFRLLFALTVL